MLIPSTLATGAAVLMCALSPALGASAVKGAELDVDLTNASGTPVLSLVGSVSNATGRGYATSAPLHGAGAMHMMRGENFVLRRRADGTINAYGGLGSRLTIHVTPSARYAEATGTIARRTRGRSAFAVTGAGVSASSPYRPAKGDYIVVVGKTSGAMRAALSRRYRLRTYNATSYSRGALLRNPALYRRVAGVLIGPDVSAKTMIGMDLPRALYNSGRFVAASGNPRALDRVMNTVAYAHLGRRATIIRHATPALGASVHQHNQIRVPTFARVLGGAAKRQQGATMGKGTQRAFAKASALALSHQLARAEALTDAAAKRSSKARQMQSSSSTQPPTVSANVDGLAYYTVGIEQMITAQISVPGALGFLQCGMNPAIDKSTLGYEAYVFQWGTGCANTTQTQTVQIDLNPIYTVSLMQSDDQVSNQTVTETNYVQVSSTTDESGALASGTYNTETQSVQPDESLGPIGHCASSKCTTSSEVNGDAAQGMVHEAGLVLAQAIHQIYPTCSSSGCTSTTNPTRPGSVEIQYNAGASSPAQRVTQVNGSTSSSTSWDDSTNATTGWNVGGNIGAFGSTPTAGVSGGYSSSTTTSTSHGGSVSSSVSYTLANWTTSPYQSTPTTNGSPLVQYSTYSSMIPGAAGTSAPAATAVAYPTLGTGNNAGMVSTPTQFGGQNGPGPICQPSSPAPTASAMGNSWMSPSTIATWGYDSSKSCAFDASLTPLGTWQSPFGYGSQMNVNGYNGGSVTSFNVWGTGGSGGANGLAVGSISPNVVDNLQLVDQASMCKETGNGGCNWQGAAAEWTQLQIQNQQDVQVATNSGVGTTQNATDGTGIGTGITTYYNSEGQVDSQASSGGYQTTGLDLCAPPVLTQQLWDDGCMNDPSLNSENPPANSLGTMPVLSGTYNGTAVTTSPGQSTTPQMTFVSPGSPISCSQGAWSGSPTGYTYKWQQWNPTFSSWQTIGGATSANFITPGAPGAVIMCTVTATNQWGQAAANSYSVETSS